MLLVCGGTLVLPSVAATGLPLAYLDPGTGMVLLQAILGLFMGIAVAVGVWWRRLKAFVGRMFGRGVVPKDDE